MSKRITRLFGLLLLIFICASKADTLTFIAQEEPGGSMNYDWFSADCWFVPGPGGILVHAGRIPTVDDSVITQTDVNAAGNSIALFELTVGKQINGGNFDVRTVGMKDGSRFMNSTVHVAVSFATDGLAYIDGGVLNIDPGAFGVLGYLDPRTSGSLGLSSDAIVNNQGSFILSAATSLSALGHCTFNNNPGADVRANGSAMITGAGTEFTFNNQGTVRVDKGTLVLDTLIWRSDDGSGTFYAAADTTLQHRSTLTVPPNVTFTFKGAGRHLFSNNLKVTGTMQVGARDPFTQAVDIGHVELAAITGLSDTGDIRVISDPGAGSTFTWTSGHLGFRSFSIERGGQLLIAGAGGNGTSYVDAGIIYNFGSTIVAGTAGLSLTTSTLFLNQPGATFEMQTDAGISGGGSPESLFRNMGVFRKTAGSFTTQITTAFENSGTVEAVAGSFNFQRAFNQLAGELIVRSGQTMNAGGTGFSIGGGKVSGSGTLTGLFYGGGTISPGLSQGILTISAANAVPFTFNSVIDIEIGGLTPGTEFDQLNISTTAILDGALTVHLVNGYRPSPGDSFKVLRFADKRNSIGVFNGLDLGDGLFLRPVYSATDLTLVATQGTVEPTIQIAATSEGPKLTFPTEIGLTYQVEYSSDLVLWLPLLRFVADTNSREFTDNTVTSSYRFYRVH